MKSLRSRPASEWGLYLVPKTLIPCARTGTFPPMGSTVGENGSLRVPSGFTFGVFLRSPAAH
jgi:hypothetical protein